MKKLILVILVILSFGNSQTVTLDPITPQNYCTGDSYAISFQVLGGPFNPGNTFTLELSDNSGNFASPTILGTLNITGSGTFNHVWGVFPYGIGYRVRVTASDPSFTSLPSSSLTLSPVLNGNTIGSQQTICAGNGITLTGSLPSGGSGTYVYQWESSSDDVAWSNIFGQTNQNMSSITPSVTSYFRRKAESVTPVCAALYSSSTRVDVLSIISNNTILSDQTICAGITISGISGSIPTGGTGSYSYQWQSSSNLVSWQTIPGFAAQDFNYNLGLSATTYFRRSVSDGFCNSNSGHIQITVIPGIGNNTIAVNQTLCLGNTSSMLTGTLPTGGMGFPLYQWEESNNNSDWSTITGASTLNFNAGSPVTTQFYRRRVNDFVCSSISNSVSILILPVLANNLIGTDQTICLGTTPALFTGSLPSGGNNQFAYQWETSSNNIAWTTLSGSTSQNLSYLQSISSSLYFRRIVSNMFCGFSTSGAVSVSVIPILSNNTIGSGQTLCQGSAAALTGTLPSGGTGTYLYEWFSSTNDSIWIPITNGTSIQLNTGALSSSNYFYRRISSGPCQSNSVSVRIVVNLPITSNSVGSNQTVCFGNSVSIAGSQPLGGSGVYGYQWESSSDNNSWDVVSGETGRNLNPTLLSTTTYFRRKVESLTLSCDSTRSTSIRVDVVMPIGNNTILSDQTICAGITISGITGSIPTGGTGSYSYQWQSSSNLVSWQTIPGFAAQDFNYNFGLSASTYFRRSVSDGFCNSNSGHIQITVIPGIGNNTIGNSQTLCIGNPSGTITGSLPTGGNGLNSYQWQSSNDNSVWSDISGATIISFAPGLVTSNTYFRRGVTAGLCNAFTNPVTILIVPVLTNNLVGSNQTICSGGSPALFTGSLPNGGNNQFLYQWETSINDIGWTVLSGSTNQNLSYLQSMSSSLYFRRIVTNPFCSFSTSSSVFVSVIPIITNNTVGSNQTLCQGSAASLTGTLPLGGTGLHMYQWFSGSDNISWSPIANATTSQFNTGTLISSAFFYRHVNSGPCQSNSGSVRITIHVPITANTIGSNQTVCANQLFSNLTGSVPLGGSGIYSYQWFSSSDDISFSPISSGTQNGFTSVSLNGTRYFRRVVSSLPCPAVTSSSIRITVNPIPSAAVITSGPLNFCTGDSVILSAPAGFNYLWSTGLSTQSITIRNSGSYSVQVTNSFNCTVLSSVLPVTVYALPTPVISGTNTVCSGNITTLSAGIYTSYLWNTGHSTPTLAVNAPGTYMVRVTDINNCVASSPSFLVTVFQTPISTIVPSGATVFCEGNLLVLSGSTGVSHSWNTGGMTDTIQVFRSGYYIDTITSPEGCRSWSGINILVNPNPRPRISYSTSLDFCDGDSVRLQLSSQLVSYLWNNGSMNPGISVTQSGTYSVQVVDQNGCVGNSDTVAVVKNSVPAITLSPSGSVNVCMGSSVTLQAGGGNQYVWSNGVSGSELNVSVSGTYTVIGSLNGCSGRSPAVIVTIIDPPQPNFIADGPLRFCQGDSVVLSAISSPPYLWSNGSVQSSISVKSTGSYSLISNLAGCSRTSGSIEVLVDTLPIIQIAASDTLFCAGDTIALQLLSSGLNQVQWSSGQTFQTIRTAQAGDYFLKGWDGNNCATNSDTIRINNYPVTLPKIIIAGDSVLCPNDSAALTFTQGVNPIWNTGDTSSTLWVKSSGVYSVILQDSFGCRVPSNTISISAVEMPEIRITANGPFQICEGDSVLLSASETEGIFNWSNGDTTSQTTITQTGNYILEYFDFSGKCAVLDSVFIDVKNIPPVEIESASTDIACRGDKLDLSTSSVYESYFWNTGDTTRSISIQTSGVYQVSVSAFGCERQTSLPIMLGFQAPQEALVLKADDINTGILICREEGKQYLWGYEYKENNNGQEFFVCDGDCRPWIKFDYLDTAQFYYWAYVGDDNCLQKWYWNGNGGLREGRFDTPIIGWKVYPNPFSSTMFLSIPDNHLPLKVELINNMGEVIREFPVQSFVEGDKLRMELFDIPAGVYWLSIRHDSGREVIEVMKQ